MLSKLNRTVPWRRQQCHLPEITRNYSNTEKECAQLFWLCEPIIGIDNSLWVCLFSLIGFSIKQVICLFFTVLGSLPYEYKIVIAGNHELTFDQEFMADLIKQDFYYFPSVSKLKPESYENVQSLLTNCIYLQDSEVTVRGFRIYGSPW